MTTINKFEELEIWQAAGQLNKDICSVLENLQRGRNYKLKEPLDSSAGSRNHKPETINE